MNFRSGRKKNDSSVIDFTPIVDCVFNLIIFFALSLNFIGTPAIKLQLPRASGKESVREKSEVRVFITRAAEKSGYTHGTFIVEGKKLSLDDIRKMINQRFVSEKNLVVVIQADESVAQGEVVKIMDIARSAGVEKIAIATRPKDNE